MIIREQKNNFVMIRQHDHALISEEMTKKMKKELLPDDDWRRSVFYAIKMHDVGWINFDAEPFWNDEEQSPYSFIDYPNRIKTILYKHGIDEVAKEDLYAGLLCSKHFAHFLIPDSSSEASQFVEQEKSRQQAIQEKLGVDDEVVAFHFDLLRFADNLSLFLCLNEPGEETHYFFKKGIRLPERFLKPFGKRLHLEWMNNQTIVSSKPLFEESFTLSIPFKKVSKEKVAEQGIRKSYEEAGEETFTVLIK